MQMERACTIVYVHVCIIYVRTWRRIADVSGAAAGMQIMQRILCNAAQRSMHICMGEVPLWDIESRVQGAGGVQGELAMLRVYVKL